MRVIQVYDSYLNIWREIEFKELVTNNVFRIFDNGERFVSEDGNNVWVAKSEAYLTEDNVWKIDTLY